MANPFEGFENAVGPVVPMPDAVRVRLTDVADEMNKLKTQADISASSIVQALKLANSLTEAAADMLKLTI